MQSRGAIIVFAVAFAIVCLFQLSFSFFTSKIESDARSYAYEEETYMQLLSPDTVVDGLIIVFVVSIVPAMSDEVFFRGFIQKSFELRYRPILAIVITAAFFSAYHFNPYGIIPLFILGMYLGFAVYITNSIFVAVILHFVNNLTAILGFFIFGEPIPKNIVSWGNEHGQKHPHAQGTLPGYGDQGLLYRHAGLWKRV